MLEYDLYTFLKEELGNGSKDLVTRPSGEKIRQRVIKVCEAKGFHYQCRGGVL